MSNLSLYSRHTGAAQCYQSYALLFSLLAPEGKCWPIKKCAGLTWGCNRFLFQQLTTNVVPSRIRTFCHAFTAACETGRVCIVVDDVCPLVRTNHTQHNEVCYECDKRRLLAPGCLGSHPFLTPFKGYLLRENGADFPAKTAPEI